MQTVKALYKEGNIQLLTPIQGVDEAELFIIVLDKDEQQATAQTKTYRPQQANSEQDFQSIGLASFFDGNEDNNVDWEDFFNVKPR